MMLDKGQNDIPSMFLQVSISTNPNKSDALW
jgi:hypothetical protein